MIPPTILSAESARLQILEAEARYREGTYVNMGGPVLNGHEDLANWYHEWRHTPVPQSEPDWDVASISRITL